MNLFVLFILSTKSIKSVAVDELGSAIQLKTSQLVKKREKQNELSCFPNRVNKRRKNYKCKIGF
jgi:hypothetical protein